MLPRKTGKVAQKKYSTTFLLVVLTKKKKKQKKPKPFSAAAAYCLAHIALGNRNKLSLGAASMPLCFPHSTIFLPHLGYVYL